MLERRGIDMDSTSRPQTTSASSQSRPHRRIDWRRPARALTTSLIDIDVSMTDIVFERRSEGLSELSGRWRGSVADYAIEGIVRAAPSDEGEASFEPLHVYVSGYEQADRLDKDEEVDPRSVCYIANDRNPDSAWRTNIYIEGLIFRRLVELYSSKRIDSAQISILVKVLRDPSGKVDVPALRHPMLRTVGDRRFQHSRAHLMSIQTALGSDFTLRRASAFRTLDLATVARRRPKLQESSIESSHGNNDDRPG